MTIEQRLTKIIRAFHTDAFSSAVNLNVDLDVDLDLDVFGGYQTTSALNRSCAFSSTSTLLIAGTSTCNR
jgi:hypothetical protein